MAHSLKESLEGAREAEVVLLSVERRSGANVVSTAVELEDSTFTEWSTYVGPLDVESGVDLVDSPWTRTSVLLFGQLIRLHLRSQNSTAY